MTDHLIENDSNQAYDLAEPRPDSLIQSLRAFGYDLSTALADIIDNSISANAKNIDLEFYWDGPNSFISIFDDGMGMTEAELINAMRPGSKSPLEERSPKDLGRFGLGLKTASFSQSKKLTVISKTSKSNAYTRCWDLDYVTQTGEWRLLKAGSSTAHDLSRKLESRNSGTIVLLESLDRLTMGMNVDSSNDKDKFLEDADRVKTHIAMVFHRFIERVNGTKIAINGRAIKPWDPFLVNEAATQNLTEELHDILGGRLTVKPYILPHVSKLTEEKHSAASGPNGWNAQQGFYVYRNSRLVVAGDWLGLGFQKEEHYKLARIALDIPNSMDEFWELDVKKSRAYPPKIFRRELKRISQLTRQRAAEVYRHRGKIIAREYSSNFSYTWDRKVIHGKIFYTINRNHPFVKSLLENSENGKEIKSLVKLIEETIPLPLITVDNTENPGKQGQPFEGVVAKEIFELASSIYDALIVGNVSRDDAKNRLRLMEPFNLYYDELEKYINDLGKTS